MGNTVSIVIVQQYFDRCVETDVCLSAYCIETAVLVVLYEVSAQQRIYTPQYAILIIFHTKLKQDFIIHPKNGLLIKTLVEDTKHVSIFTALDFI
jgi:hypothetical protein